jgi:hypothetical protein
LTGYIVDFVGSGVSPSIGEVYNLTIDGHEPDCYTIQRATEAASNLLLSASSVYASCEECQSENQ